LITWPLLEWARGDLPPGVLGEDVLREVGDEAAEVAEVFANLKAGQLRQVGVNIELLSGVRVVGTVTDVYEDSIVRATFSKAKPKHELQVWPQLLALSAGEPQAQWTAYMLAFGGGFRLTAPPAEEAIRILAELLDLYVAGGRAPLPLPAATSSSYAKRRAEGKDVAASLRAATYASWQRNANDRSQAEIVALWGPEADISVLLEEKPELGENWFDEPSRFGMLARRLWTPILAARSEL
jgi:exodeoxyribonuclease V gamma subunit